VNAIPSTKSSIFLKIAPFLVSEVIFISTGDFYTTKAGDPKLFLNGFNGLESTF
jgi:hypothetical protein